jgi:hypothetical protein
VDRGIHYLEMKLGELPQPARADISRLLRAVPPHVTRKWTRYRGVGWWWFSLHESDGDGGEVRIEPVRWGRGEIMSDYMNDIGHSFTADVRGRMGTARCVALVYGSGYRSSNLWSIDARVIGTLEHVAGVQMKFDMAFDRRGRVLPHIRFDPSLAPMLRRMEASAIPWLPDEGARYDWRLLPAGAEVVPESAFTNADGELRYRRPPGAYRRWDPGEFRRDVLESARASYQDLLARVGVPG